IVSLNFQTFALGASLLPNAEFDSIDSNGDQCLVAKSNGTNATQLIFLRGKSRRSIDINHLRFVSDFVLSKDARAIATFQPDRPVYEDSGRVLIYSVTTADPR